MALIPYGVMNLRCPGLQRRHRQPFRGVAQTRESGRFVESSAGTKVHSRVAPRPGGVVVTKAPGERLCRTDINMILRSNRVQPLVLAFSPAPPRPALYSPLCGTPPTPTAASWSSRTAARTTTLRCTPSSRRRWFRG